MFFLLILGAVLLTYQQILRRLKLEIRFGLLRPGDLLPPEPQFSTDLGVSRKTLRRAFAELESESLIIRRRHTGTIIGDLASNKLNVPLHIGAVFSKASWANNIPALSLPEYGVATEMQLLLQIILEQGENLQFLSDQYLIQNPELWDNFDALIFYPPNSINETLKAAADRAFPHINIENHLAYDGVNTVTADDEQAAYDCTKELLEKGHRKIIFIGGALGEENRNCGFLRRTKGYLRAYKEFSLPEPEESWIFNIHGQSQYTMSELLEDYSERTKDCTAIVAAIGHSVLELERLREIYGETLFPELPLRCIDLEPLHTGSENLTILTEYKGFIKPRRKVAELSWEILLEWILKKNYQTKCHYVPFKLNNPRKIKQKELIYVEI